MERHSLKSPQPPFYKGGRRGDFWYRRATRISSLGRMVAGLCCALSVSHFSLWNRSAFIRVPLGLLSLCRLQKKSVFICVHLCPIIVFWLRLCRAKFICVPFGLLLRPRLTNPQRRSFPVIPARGARESGSAAYPFRKPRMPGLSPST
jgi:hypothetical protein